MPGKGKNVAFKQELVRSVKKYKIDVTGKRELALGVTSLRGQEVAGSKHSRAQSGLYWLGRCQHNVTVGG
ncbi:hypothetical protein ElyMa_005518500 [Elysia marginata]|uniref:Uncharacterized protein n=1 Tax=Elysia marginata TaxID=1093978 RepID=A0AAV4EV62_9GAST|nr:hypothetical protein ElyMa_005518500 [Elysia marginata]